jgi:hypothetical protein
MQKIILFLSLVLATVLTQAQNSWKVYHNGELLLNATEENVKANTVTIPRANLEKHGDFIFIYSSDTVSKNAQRNFSMGDSTFSPVAKNNKYRFTLTNKQFKELMNHSDKAVIDTWPFFKDRAIAAAVKIRRVHLCTVLLR